jgi:hypothetical protein
MDALQGKKDILADVEKQRSYGSGGGGSGAGKGGGGGGGGGFNSGDWERFRREAGETLKATGIIVGAVRGPTWTGLSVRVEADRAADTRVPACTSPPCQLLLFATWRQLLAVLINALFWIFRCVMGGPRGGGASCAIADWSGSPPPVECQPAPPWRPRSQSARRST